LKLDADTYSTDSEGPNFRDRQGKE